MRKYKSFLSAVLGVFLLLSGNVFANAEDIRLTVLSDYVRAQSEGRLLPVTQMNEGLRGLHPEIERGDSVFSPSEVRVLPQLESRAAALDPHPGVLMFWGNGVAVGTEIVGAWELVLPGTHDLTAMCISLVAWPRTDMSSISFSLVDINGVMKGWRWPVASSDGSREGLPTNQGTKITICASGGANQAGATVFWDGGLDITQIYSFQFDESGVAMGDLILPNSTDSWVGQWNYWHDIIVLNCHCHCCRCNDQGIEEIEAKLDAIEIKLNKLPTKTFIRKKVIQPLEFLEDKIDGGMTLE